MAQTWKQYSSVLQVSQSQVYTTNSGILISENQALLIDPALLPAEINAIADFIDEQQFEPQYVVLTHSHWDHLFGPEYLPGVKTIAQQNYLLQTSAANGEHILAQVRKFDDEYHIPRKQPFVLPKADETFAEEKDLRLGDLSLRLLHAPGHASDQLVVYQPDHAILWAADMLSDLEIPFVSHNLEAYRSTLEMLAGLSIRTLIPGHGHVTQDPADIQSRLDEDRAYLDELYQCVQAGIQAGKEMDEIVSDCAHMAFRLPVENRHPHQLNVESAYLELGGRSEMSNIGWRRE
jgi:hydroxyacylglutathione hydrolase